VTPRPRPATQLACGGWRTAPTPAAERMTAARCQRCSVHTPSVHSGSPAACLASTKRARPALARTQPVASARA